MILNICSRDHWWYITCVCVRMAYGISVIRVFCVSQILIFFCRIFNKLRCLFSWICITYLRCCRPFAELNSFLFSLFFFKNTFRMCYIWRNHVSVEYAFFLWSLYSCVSPSEWNILHCYYAYKTLNLVLCFLLLSFGCCSSLLEFNLYI